MATTSQNTQVYSKNDILYYPVLSDGNGDINQGDFVYFDTSAKVVKSIGSNANAATAAGVAMQQSVLNVYGTKQYPQGGIQVATKGIFTFKTTVGDTLQHGESLYIGADAQTLTDVDPGSGNVIAYVWLRIGTAAAGSITGAAGTNVEALIKPLFPFVGV